MIASKRSYFSCLKLLSSHPLVQTPATSQLPLQSPQSGAITFTLESFRNQLSSNQSKAEILSSTILQDSTATPTEEHQELVLPKEETEKNWIMRSGVCAVQQALTTEVASVLKHSLDLARRRGHAQVTPLHVAATLMSSSSASSDLLRRACLKSQPHHPSSHPLQCRALELCFNVALNRLPTTSPPSSGTLIPSPSSLSNSLIAALKRAHANQRRGCIELQQQQLQQQPLLSIKVEMEQLMLSILDDPSVSRVMKEAGFSSSCVKNNLEEQASALSRCSQILWQSSPQKEDLEMVMEVMLRSANTVVVGDSASMTQGLVTELMSRLEKGEVPGDLKCASFINLQFSYSHLRVMSKGDVELKVADLRRTIKSLGSDSVVVYAGDLRWAVDDEGRDRRGFNPVEHMVTEMGRLLCEFKCSAENKVSLLATSSYGTYMRCQMRQPSLEALWALQAVVVPSGWLALSPQATSSLDSRGAKFGQFPFQLLESQVLRSKEDEKFICCDECTSNLEKECSDIKSKTSWWLQGDPESNHKQVLLELRRKWNKLCRSLHHNRTQLWPPLFNQSLISKSYCKSITNSWWPTGLFSNRDKNFIQPHSKSFSASAENFNTGLSSAIADKEKEKDSLLEKFLSVQWSSDASLNSVKMSANQQVKTALALSTPLLSDSATSKDQTSRLIADPIDLQYQLQHEMPWQSNTIPSIMEAIREGLYGDKKAIRLLIRGSDNIAKRRLASVIANSFFGANNKLVQIKQRTSSIPCLANLKDALRKDQKCVFLIENVERMNISFIRSLNDALKLGYFEDTFGAVSLIDAFFILTTSTSTEFHDSNDNDNVLMMKFCVEDLPEVSGTKRKSENDMQNGSKKQRAEEHSIDLNIQANEDSQQDSIPSVTHEPHCIDLHLPQELLDSTAQLTLNAGCGDYQEVKLGLLSKLHGAFDEVQSGKDEKSHLFIDSAVTEELMKSSAFFLASLFENWVKEVYKTSIQGVKEGVNLRLKLEGRERNAEEFSFMGSVLPNRIIMD